MASIDEDSELLGSENPIEDLNWRAIGGENESALSLNTRRMVGNGETDKAFIGEGDTLAIREVGFLPMGLQLIGRIGRLDTLEILGFWIFFFWLFI